MLTLILEAAFRSAIMAAAVWAGIRALRVHNVLAQKIAWVLVLVGAAIMPLVMRVPFLPATGAIKIPVRAIPGTSFENHVREAFEISEPLGANIASGVALASGVRFRNMELSGVPVSTPKFQTKLQTKPLTAKWTSQVSKSAISMRQNRPSASSAHVSDPGPSSVQAQGAGSGAPSGTPRSSSDSYTLPIRSMLYLIYVAGATFLVVRNILALSFARRIWKRSVPIPTASLGMAPDSLHSTKSVRIRVSPDLSSPATVGSTVLLPADYSEWDEAKLRIVLAHELSHVRQRDFYLQLAAAVHASVFWFSPVGWWLKSKLSDLGEALSDRAGLAQADSPFSYAQILLEFAAVPRKPSAGVAMARSSNLSSRIDRIVNNNVSRLAFLGGRRHALAAGVLAPLALLAAVCCIRIVPEVEAAQNRNVGTVQSSTQSSNTTQNSAGNTTSSSSDTVTNSTNRTGQVSSTSSDQVTTTDSVQTTDTITPQAPTVAPMPPAPAVEAPALPEPPEEGVTLQAPEPPSPPEHAEGFGVAYSMDDSDQHSFAIVGGKDSNITINGRHSKEFEEARAKYHHNFIWFERDGKSYVITDPAIVAQGTAMFNFDSDPRTKMRQEQLQRMQSKLDQEMKNLQPEIDKASLPGPEFQEQMAKLNTELAQLQSDKFKHLDEQIAKAMKDSGKVDQKQIQEITQEKLGELSEKMGEIQGQIGEIQGKIGERQGLLGEKQGEIGERMGKVGEEMGRIGEEQGRRAESASRKMQSVLDQAVKDGKARPVN